HVPPTPHSTLFPYTTLFRSLRYTAAADLQRGKQHTGTELPHLSQRAFAGLLDQFAGSSRNGSGTGASRVPSSTLRRLPRQVTSRSEERRVGQKRRSRRSSEP